MPQQEVYVLKDLEQVKVLADPLRLRILEAFCEKPRTTKQVAQLLGEKPTKLYHHVESLERVGLIKLVKTRRNRGTVEKYYQAVAKDFTVDRELFAVRPQPEEAIAALQDMFTGALEATLSELRESIAEKLIQPADEGRPAVLARSHIRTTHSQIEKLKVKLQEWFEECQAADQEEGGVEYGLTVAFYPIKGSKTGRKVEKEVEDGASS